MTNVFKPAQILAELNDVQISKIGQQIILSTKSYKISAGFIQLTRCYFVVRNSSVMPYFGDFLFSVNNHTDNEDNYIDIQIQPNSVIESFKLYKDHDEFFNNTIMNDVPAISFEDSIIVNQLHDKVLNLLKSVT